MILSVNKYQKLIACSTTLEKVEVLHGSIDELTKDEVMNLINKYNRFICGEFRLRSEPKIKIGEHELYFYSPYNFTFGEFIDLHEYRKQNDIASQLTMCFRKCKSSDIDEDVWEDYGDWVRKRKKYFEAMEFEAIGGHFKTINTYYNDVIKGLREDEEEEDVESNDDDLTNFEREKKEIDKRKQEVKKSYFWEHSLYTLCAGDVSKFEKVLKMNAIMVFNIIKMKKTLEI